MCGYLRAASQARPKAINRHGGNATLVELPKIGIYGNTHFLMQDLNNGQLADLLGEWLEKNDLGK